MKIELPKTPSVSVLLYIIGGACLFAAPNILFKLGYVDSVRELSFLKMLGGLIALGGLFSAFYLAVEKTDGDRN